MVAGVGNKPESLRVGAPANIDGVVAVGAVDRTGKHAAVSVTGKEVLLCAPGVDIVSTSINGGYRTGTGTSDSTAIVAGVAALVRSRFPNLSATEVIHRLTATATDIGPPGRDDECGYGIVNPVAALTADVPPVARSGSSSAATVPPVTPTPPATVRAAPPTGGPRLVLVIGVAVAVGTIAVLAWAVLGRRRRRRRTG